MKILHLILSRGFAGSERSTSESCNAQVEAGHAVMLAVRRSHRGRAGASILDHLDARVQVCVLPDFWFTRRRLAACIERFAPDIVHCHLRRATRLVAKIRPAAATVSTLHITWNSPYFHGMDGIICNARWQFGDIPADYRGKTFKANNSLIPHRRLDPQERERLRQEFGVSEGTYFIGGAGRMAKKKGWDMLIRAFRESSLPDTARLVIFGTGSATAFFEQCAAGDARIRLAGFRKDIKDIYQALDLFVCPSRFEPLPRVMLEAMDAGVPVVASTAGGCKELIEDYGGDLFEVEDIPTLTRLLERHHAERTPHRYVDLSAHHVQNASRAMLTFYSELIASRRAEPSNG